MSVTCWNTLLCSDLTRADSNSNLLISLENSDTAWWVPYEPNKHFLNEQYKYWFVILKKKLAENVCQDYDLF